MGLNKEMTARLCISVAKRTNTYCNSLAAIAEAFPAPAPVSLLHWFDCHEVAETLACDINHSGHSSLAQGCSVKWRLGARTPGRRAMVS